MVNGTIFGIVIDNRDPSGMHRVKVEFPVEAGFDSSWCRIVTPMAGKNRGLVMLPEVGTEVALMMSHRSLSPYVVGAVYNGREDKPTPYKNDDESNDRRVFWSRSQHLVDFNDCEGSESVGLGACATVRLNVESAPIHQVHDSAGESIRQYCAGSTFFEGTQRFSVRCKTFSLEAERISLSCGNNTAIQAQQVTMECGGSFRATSPDTQVKTPSTPPAAIAASEASPCLHPPTRPEDKLAAK